MACITKSSESLPFDPDAVTVVVSEHFRNTWMLKWGWDQYDLRDAMRDAYRASRVGRTKWELFMRKKGWKKVILDYDPKTEKAHVITGAEG